MTGQTVVSSTIKDEYTVLSVPASGFYIINVETSKANEVRKIKVN